MSRKFKIGGSEKSLRDWWKEKLDEEKAKNESDREDGWKDKISSSEDADDDFKEAVFKINKKGEMVPVIGNVTLGADDIKVAGSKSSLRRIADLERNVVVLANRIATIDNESDVSEGSEDDFDNWITETTAFTKDVTLGRSGSTSWWGGSSTSRVDVDGHLYINNGITFGSTAVEELQDKVGAMFSGSETGISVTYNDSNGTATFSVTDAPKWRTARTLSLTGDASGSVSWDGSANASITVAVANDSHTHAFANVTGKPTTLAGYGITDAASDSDLSSGLSGKVSTNSAQALHATDALTVSNDTITLHKADGTSESVSIADANTWRGVYDGLDSTSTSVSLTANQGRVLNNRIDTLIGGTPATTLDTIKEIADAISANDTAIDTLATKTSAQVLRATDALTVSNDTITIHKGDGTSESVSISDANTNYYTSAVSFNTTNGVLTLTGAGGRSNLTVDLDGRYTDNGYADAMNQHVRTSDSPTFAAVTATDFNGTATYAKYADLAERYAADAPYSEGTVVVFGGEAEVTASTSFAQRSVAGVVSLRPAVAMNSEAGNNETHPYIALQGRVPVKVTGDVKKGDILVASDVAGTATAWNNDDADPRMTAYVGIAIADAVDGFVEVKVGK